MARKREIEKEIRTLEKSIGAINWAISILQMHNDEYEKAIKNMKASLKKPVAKKKK